MRALLLFALVPALAPAQIQSFAANNDGSRLWFQSGYNLKTDPDDQISEDRIYAYKPGSADLVTRPASDRVNVLRPYMSADGKTSGWHTYTPCFGSCMLWIPREGLVLDRNGGQFEVSYRNTMNLSRNGRWIFEGGFPFYDFRLIDLDTGAEVSGRGLNALHTRHVVSDAGVVVGMDPTIPGLETLNEIKLWRAGEEPRSLYKGASAVTSAGISADGKAVFLTNKRNELIRIAVANGAYETVLSADRSLAFSMNTDASRVAVLTGDRQITLLGSKILYVAPESVTQFELTDDGSQIIVLTAANRLVRIRVDSEEVEELYGPLIGRVRFTSYSFTPGSAIRVSTPGFTEDMTFTSANLKFPVAKIDQDEFQVQIPWEYPTGEWQLFRVAAPESPFEVRGLIAVESVVRPYVFTKAYFPEVLASQQDFSGLVTQETPAPAGSTIHLWVTGLGRLDRIVNTGEKGPSDPAAHPVTPFACYLRRPDGQAVGLKLPYLAYAAGLIGMYQVDATLPDNWLAGKSILSCTADNRYFSGGELWIQ